MIFSNKFIKAVTAPAEMEKFVPAPYFRKEFTLEFTHEAAELTICGLGFYEVYINGLNITKGPLAPYISNPNDVLYYDNYDISEYLKKGKNVIGILLGNGFRNPYGAFEWGMDKARHRGAPAVALCIEADGEGQSIKLEADESFRVHPSPIVYDDMRMGYCYDARLELPEWNKVGFDDSKWEKAMTEATPVGTKRLCEVEKITVTEELTAKEVRHYDRLPFDHKVWTDGEPFEDTYRDNVYVYDFGINTAGVTKLSINGEPGQKIIIRHGETTVKGHFTEKTTVFQRGEEHTRLYHEYGQTDTFICKGGYEEFVPRFKYDGFRYAYVEGLKPEQATETAVTYLVMHSDIERRSGFSCSDEVLNKIYDCTINSDYSNFFYFPTDCPHREKLGWTGDGWLSSEQMLLNLTVETSLREWMYNIRLAQRADGALPGIIPTDGWGFEWGNGAFFDSVCVQIPYYLYRFTGDAEIIRENTQMIMRYLSYTESKRDERGLAAYGLGDWCDPYEKDRGSIAAPLELVSSIAIFDMAKKASFLFGRTGDKENAEYASELARDIKMSIRDKLIDFETMTAKGECQTSQVLSVATGIFEEAELGAAFKRLVEIIHRDGDTNACGVYGERFLYHTLAKYGECNLAYKMITSKRRTGYGYWIENGATSLWERWNFVEGATSDNSMNHHFHGHVSSFFVQDIVGIKPNPNADNVRYFEISPSFVSELEDASGYYLTSCGKVSAEWKRNGDVIRLNISAPKGTSGKVILNNRISAEWTSDSGYKEELIFKTK